MLRTTETNPTPSQRGPAAAPIRRALLLGALLAGLLCMAFQAAPADAAVWVRESSGTTDGLAAISCVAGIATNVCKAGGSLNTIVSYDGIRWSVEASPRGSVIWDLDCVSPAFCKATDGSRVLAYDGTSWRDERAPVGGIIGGAAAVSCPSASFCKVVGSSSGNNDGAVWSWNGSAWSADGIGSIDRLLGVTCLSTTFCKAVGMGGTILSYDGTRWRAEPSGTTEGLWRVSCASASFCKAVGEDGTILSFDGSAWSIDAAGRPERLQGVSCPSASFCKAVGERGTIWSWDGGAWRGERSGTSELLADVSCLSTTFCKAVGSKGTILSLAPDPAIATREVPVAVACAGAGQSCDAPMPFELPLRPSTVLRVRFVASPEQCGDIRVTLTVIFRPAQSGFIQLFPTVAASTSPFLAPGGRTEELDLGNRSDGAGEYLLSVTAEGRQGGCNTGRLERFSGALIVTSSE